MTIAKNIAAKATVAAVAAAMALSAFVVPASAQQSADELQQMINDLLLQVAALESDLGQGATSVASGVCPYTWTRDLSQGSTGGDVMKLQQFLNLDPRHTSRSNVRCRCS
jgi:long-subunit acyl-CoA synthetase (AMP-forming)